VSPHRQAQAAKRGELGTEGGNGARGSHAACVRLGRGLVPDLGLRPQSV